MSHLRALMFATQALPTTSRERPVSDEKQVSPETVKRLQAKTRWPSAHNSNVTTEWKLPRLKRVQRLVNAAMEGSPCCEEHRYRAALDAFVGELDPGSLGDEWLEESTLWTGAVIGLYALHFDGAGMESRADVRISAECVGEGGEWHGAFGWAYSQIEFEAEQLLEKLGDATPANWQQEIAAARAAFEERKTWVYHLLEEHYWGFVGGDPNNQGDP